MDEVIIKKLRQDIKPNPEYWKVFFKRRKRDEEDVGILAEEKKKEHEYESVSFFLEGDFQILFKQAVAYYTIGDNQKSKEYAIKAIDPLIDYVVWHHEMKDVYTRKSNSIPFYYYMSLMALLVLYDVPQKEVQRLYDALQVDYSYSWQNYLVDSYFNYFHVFNRPVGGPKFNDEMDMYAELQACYETSDVMERRKHLENFMRRWRNNTKGEFWWDFHNEKRYGHAYFGYWSFVAAATAKVLDIDDSHLKKHKYYPYYAHHPEQEKL